MSRIPDPGFDPRIADWLETDPTLAPRDVMRTVASAIPSVPQRRAWRLPWRPQPMVRLLIVIGLVALVAAGLGLAGVGSSRPPAPTIPPSPSPTRAAVPIADGSYASEVIPVDRILLDLEADDALSATTRESVIDILGIRDATTLRVLIEIDGDVLTVSQQFDDLPPVPDQPWTMAPIDADTIDVGTPCCGHQTYGVRTVADGFELTPISSATSAVEAAVRRTLFQSSPFQPVEP